MDNGPGIRQWTLLQLKKGRFCSRLASFLEITAPPLTRPHGLIDLICMV